MQRPSVPLRPSTVMMSAPSAPTASIRHDRTVSPFDQHGAGAAHAVLAPDVGAGEPQRVAEHVDQEPARLDGELVTDAVDGER